MLHPSTKYIPKKSLSQNEGEADFKNPLWASQRLIYHAFKPQLLKGKVGSPAKQIYNDGCIMYVCMYDNDNDVVVVVVVLKIQA